MSQATALHLKQIFAEDLQVASVILELLKLERKALSRLEHQQVEDITVKKMAAYRQLENHHLERQQLLTELHYSLDKRGMHALFDSFPHPYDRELKLKHAELREQLEKCQIENEMNSTIVAIGRHNNQRIMHLLQGRDSSEDLYGSKGQLTSHQRSNGHREV